MSDTEINLGFISGVVSSPLEHRQNDWGESVEFSLRHFVRSYTDTMGIHKTIQHEFKMSCQTKAKMQNPCYREVRSLAPGDWVLLKIVKDQIHYEKNGEQKSFTKDMVVGLESVQRASDPRRSQPTAPGVSSDPAIEPPLTFWTLPF